MRAYDARSPGTYGWMFSAATDAGAVTDRAAERSLVLRGRLGVPSASKCVQLHCERTGQRDVPPRLGIAVARRGGDRAHLGLWHAYDDDDQAERTCALNRK